MKIGLPLEIMIGEGRIALTPCDCKQLVDAGNTVYLQQDAGKNSAYPDSLYKDYGVEIVANAQQLYEQAQLIVKVKQPLAQDIQYLRQHHVLFSYLHLAADIELIESLRAIGLCAIPFESVVGEDGGLPLLAPMSQVAGRIAMIRGASLLFRNRGGRGVLLGGVDGSDRGQVVVLGAGIAGSHAVAVAASLGACIDVLDIDEEKLQQLKTQHPSIRTHRSTPETVAELCTEADLVIGAVLLAGRRAPVVLPKSVVRQMHAGSVIVDIAIDQGGCVEGIHATSIEQLCYSEYGVIHSAVPNMPAAVARTSSQSLSSAILPYVHELATIMDSDTELSVTAREEGALQNQSYRQTSLRQAMAICHGEVVDTILRQELQREPSMV
ncbi:MAG: alanine dehydrogenase [Proteobacteria bacterium]|nr:alanine dehydrogenase [Pseudomonadota bacterium]